MTREEFNDLAGRLVDIADLADAVIEVAERLRSSDGAILVALASRIGGLASVACAEAEEAIVEEADHE